MTVVVTHSTPSDATFSATGATAWDANHTLSGVGTMAEQNANAVAITGGTATLTSVTTPIVQATNSAGLALKNSGGTTQISMGAGGGDNVTVSAPIAINPANGLVNISPTGTGTVTINPATAGTINNTSIGATTPAAGTFTTITGQTEVLKGTGQNLVLRSQQFSNVIYSSSSATRTDNQTTAPDGTSTGALIQAVVASYGGLVRQFSPTYLSNTTYTMSVFAKAGTSNFVGLRPTGGCVSATDAYCYFNLSNGTATAITPTSGTVVSVGTVNAGNGWYRCFVVYTTATVGNSISDFSITTATGATAPAYLGTETIFAWGFQVEFGNTITTYVPTTSAIVYGVPTLSFNSASQIGMESNGSLYVSPAGTGALQAQATTSSTVGGNARGANAVDWQTLRGAASQVASGAYSVVAGGSNNTATGFAATAAGGSGSSASNTYAFVGSGASSVASGYGASVVAGYTNTAAGFWNFIGNGYTNSGTSGSAVTTQSATMNGTTAVTLSGSNASIKVGQLITGTSITTFPNTYVAAISGTSLTLSQVASGSSTSTLSFYTPHGVVVGGGNNQATGSYSFIGGGGDAGTASNRNVASGDWSAVAGGQKNVASGQSAFVGGGGNIGGSVSGNTASAPASFIGGGFGNTASGSQLSAVVSGQSNTASGNSATVINGFGHAASGDYSFVSGGVYGTTRSIVGNHAFSACNQPVGNASGNSQSALLVIGAATTDATATALRSNTGAASGTNQVILPNNSAYFFRGEVISGVTGGGDTKGWTIEGVIKRGANAASTALVGTPTVVSTYADVGAATWAIAVTADTTNGGLRVTFTGQAATTIRTVCSIRSTEMTF